MTYTGNGVAGRAVPHDLNGTVGFAVVKRLDAITNWEAQHVSVDLTANKGLYLNTAANLKTHNNVWNSTHATSTNLILGDHGQVNAVGGSYVAYLWASDAGGYGDDEDENIVKCGTYTGNGGSSVNSVTVGFEPQWILVKNVTAAGSWAMYDTMRGWAVSASSSDDARLFANSNGAESLGDAFNPTATGFEFQSGNATWNNSGNDFIYMAIRRPMKTPTAGTEVFTVDTRGSTGDGVNPTYRSAWPVDMALLRNVGYSSASTMLTPRLTGSQYMYANQTYAEAAANTVVVWDFMNGWYNDTGTNTAQLSWMFKRATGYMDVVAYNGSGSNTTQAHNLGVAPEMIIVKRRSSAEDWLVYSQPTGNQAGTGLNQTAATFTGVSQYWNSTTPTASVFSLGTHARVNTSSQTYIAYLFATLAGVSKVGTYTGTGADLNVDCGFTGGARFILIRRTDSSGDWYYWDYLRGITAGNDPYSILNTESAQVTGTDYVDPLNAGFTVTSSASSTVNINGGTYIFLAIA